MTDMNLTQLPIFDYSNLDSETRIIVQQRTSEIKTLMRRTAQDIIDIGNKLIEVRGKLAQNGYGTYKVWLKGEFDWSYETANNFVRVAEHFDGVNFTSSNFAPSALYLLSAPQTPESARIEAKERAEMGEPITHAKAQEIVAEHKTDTPKVRYVPTGETLPLDDFDTPEIDPDTGEILTPEPIAPVSPTPMAVHYSSASPEWYTPEHIIDRVLHVFGDIDLDPCSNSGPIAKVPANEHYTKEDNGLELGWSGRVYMNPPYGDEIGAWVEKLLREVNLGMVSDAIALVPARTDTQWFQSLAGFPVCFITGRLRFSGHTNSAPFPSAVVYIGPDLFRFHEAFGDIGKIYMPWSPA